MAMAGERVLLALEEEDRLEDGRVDCGLGALSVYESGDGRGGRRIRTVGLVIAALWRCRCSW